MKKKNYQQPAATVVTFAGSEDLMEKGNIPFGPPTSQPGRVGAKEHLFDNWDDEEGYNWGASGVNWGTSGVNWGEDISPDNFYKE